MAKVVVGEPLGPDAARASLGLAGHDLALASSRGANKWTYPTVSRMSLPKITSPSSSAPTVANQDMEQEGSRRAQLAPMCLSAC